ncbi:unnamed protein product, partial [Polarella glacialis]
MDLLELDPFELLLDDPELEAELDLETELVDENSGVRGRAQINNNSTNNKPIPTRCEHPLVSSRMITQSTCEPEEVRQFSKASASATSRQFSKASATSLVTSDLEDDIAVLPPPLLTASEDQLFQAIESVVSQLDFPVAISNPLSEDMRFAMVSEGFEAMTGYSRRELVDRELRLLSQGCPEDLETSVFLRLSGQTGDAFEAHDVVLRRKSGELMSNSIYQRGLTIGFKPQTGEKLWILISVHTASEQQQQQNNNIHRSSISNDNTDSSISSSSNSISSNSISSSSNNSNSNSSSSSNSISSSSNNSNSNSNNRNNNNNNNNKELEPTRNNHSNHNSSSNHLSSSEVAERIRAAISDSLVRAA